MRRLLGHDLDRVMPIGFEDADRPRRADAVGVQEEHDVADGLLLRPAGGDFSGAELAYARDIPQLLGACLDETSCRRATAATPRPDETTSSNIASFCASDQNRRRSRPVKISTRAINRSSRRCSRN
jgi:hypothetical protein